MKSPRILVSSMDVWNNTSGSDTFTNLLSGYVSEKVANIYLRSGIPSSIVAEKFFYVCENAVIKSIFMRKTKTGWEVPKGVEGNKKQIIETNTRIEKSRYSFFLKHRLWIFVLAREICWKLGKWKSTELIKFVDDFNPEVLFFPIESYIHFNSMNSFLIKKTGVPAIAIMWDDNFTYRAHKNPFFLVHRFFLRRSVKGLVDQSSKVFVINPKMQKEFKELYGIDAEVLTKGAYLSKSSNAVENAPTETVKMVYTGKLVYGRMETIQLIAEALDIINQNHIRVTFDIYSGTEMNQKELNSLQKRGVCFCGSVTQDKIAKIQNEADLLLLVEALSGKHKYDARLSFSTKLVDYLQMGKCIVAVGPSDNASIEYLKENDAALIAASKNEIVAVLEKAIASDVMREYGQRARKLAEEKHDICDVQRRLYQAFEMVKGQS